MIQGLIDGTEEGVRQLEKKVDDYEEFINWLDSAQETFDDLSEEEQDAFSDSFSEYAKFKDEPIPEGQVTEIKEELAANLRRPAQRGLQEQTARVLDQFGVEESAPFTRSLETEIQALDQSKIPENRNLLQRVVDQANELSQPSQQYIQNKIIADPNILFKLESDDAHLSQLVDTVREREQTIEDIAHSIESFEWIDVSNRDFGPFANTWLSKELPESGVIKSKFEQLDEFRDRFLRTIGDVSPFLSSELDNIFSKPSIGLLDPVKDLIADLKSHADVAERIETISEAREVAAEKEYNIPTQPLLKIPDKQNDRKISNQEEFQSHVQDIYTLYSRWEDEMISSWESDVQIIKNISERFKITKPDILSEVESIEAIIQEDPIRAVHQLDTLHASLADMRQEIRDASGLEDNSVDLLLDLIAEESVPISRYGIEAIESLNDSFDLEVAIDESA